MGRTRTLSKKIIETIGHKSAIKHQVFDAAANAFVLLEEILRELELKYNGKLIDDETPVKVIFTKIGNYDYHLQIDSDILIFSMHTNVFQFNKENKIWEDNYLKKNPDNGYVGQISIYNFLADSFTHNRNEDLGYLVARVFINQENHYIVEGKRQLASHDNDIAKCVVDKESLTEIIETAILYTLNFDLLIPPYDAVKIASVEQMRRSANDKKMQTGKRLGFQFNTDDI